VHYQHFLLTFTAKTYCYNLLLQLIAATHCYNLLSTACTSSEYRCSDNRCISKLWLCDGTRDCASGEDETLVSCSKYCYDSLHIFWWILACKGCVACYLRESIFLKFSHTFTYTHTWKLLLKIQNFRSSFKIQILCLVTDVQFFSKTIIRILWKINK